MIHEEVYQILWHIIYYMATHFTCYRVRTYLNIHININVICIIVPSAYFILASLDAYTKELTLFKLHASNLLKWCYLNLPYPQSSLIQSNIGVIFSKFMNKFVQKCHCYYTLSDQSIPLVTVTSVVSLLTKQLCIFIKKVAWKPQKPLFASVQTALILDQMIQNQKPVTPKLQGTQQTCLSD